MNKYFGNQLRRELINLIERPESLRSRAQSTGSERLSLDSLEGDFYAGGRNAMDTFDWKSSGPSFIASQT